MSVCEDMPDMLSVRNDTTSDPHLRLEALRLSRDIAVGNEQPSITLDRAKQFYDFLVGK